MVHIKEEGEGQDVDRNDQWQNDMSGPVDDISLDGSVLADNGDNASSHPHLLSKNVTVQAATATRQKFSAEAVVVREENNNRCDQCGRVFMYGIALKQHIIKDHGASVTPQRGGEPSPARKRCRDREDAQKNEEGMEVRNAGEEKRGGDTTLHVCGSCGKAFPSLASAEAHARLCSRIINLKEKTKERSSSSFFFFFSKLVLRTCIDGTCRSACKNLESFKR